jgi:Rod binding domain-containing protein
MSPVDSFSSGVALNSAAALSQSGRSEPSRAILNSPADQKLRKAAGEFESLLLSSLWKSMKSTFAAPESESDDPAHDTWENLGIDSMSSAVGKAGGLGLGKLILKHLEPQLALSQNENDPQSSKAAAFSADI